MTARDRSSPIRETITKIEGYPSKLSIFQAPMSRFWIVRYYTQGKILKKSTKSESKVEAIKFAKTFYEDTLLRERNLLPISSSPSFERVADGMLLDQQSLISRGEKNKKLNINDSQMLKRDILPHFRGMDIRNITHSHINVYLNKIAVRNLTPATLKKHTNLISKILSYAQREGLVDRVPTSPKIKQKDSPRGWFNDAEYKLLRTVTVQSIKDNVIVRGHPITDEMRFIITFIINSFLRPSDVKNLKNKSIQIVDNIDQSFLRIQPESSKTINSPIVTMKNAVEIYRNLLSHHIKNDCPTGPDDYVFFPKIPNRDFALQTMRRQFDWILNKAGLKTPIGGEPRTLYSLRHTSIMFRLTKGGHIDLLTLSRNARTSVAMIERFYARPLSGEMNIDMIQSMRVKPTKPSI
jgi:integrase